MKKKIISGMLTLAILGTSLAIPAFEANAKTITNSTNFTTLSFNNPATGCWGYIDGSGVKFRSSPKISSTNIIRSFDYDELVGIEVFNAGTYNGYQWSKVTDENGVTGYVASTYLYTV